MAPRERKAPGRKAAAASKPKSKAPKVAMVRKPSARAAKITAQCAVVLDKMAAALEADADAFYVMVEEQARKDVPRYLEVNREGAMWFEMACVACGALQPCLPSHFYINNGLARFHTCPAGRESFQNNPSNPCKTCWARMMRELSATDADEWVRRLMVKYKRLRATDTAQYGTRRAGWFWERWRIQGGDFVIVDGKHVITRAAWCAITFVELCLFGVKFKFSASVNNRDVANKGQANHRSEDCELVAAEVNVQQQHEDVKDLKVTWRALVVASHESEAAGAAAAEAAKLTAFEVNWANRGTKRANGVTANATREPKKRAAQCANLDLSSICTAMASSHESHDAEEGRDNDVKAKDIYAIVKEQRCRCAYTHGLVTIENGPLRFSLERVDNTKGHVQGNCIAISRMLNTRGGMTRAKFLEMRAAWLARCDN